MNILISAGHHSQAQGAQWKGYTEWQETTIWRDMIVQELGEVAIAVPDGGLREKVAFINSHDPAFAVEIHFNSAIVNGEHVGEGCETLMYPGSIKGRRLAETLQGAQYQLFQPYRGVKEGWHRQDRPGVVDYQGDVDGDETINYFLRKTKCPAVILEPDFIHFMLEKIQPNRKAASLVLSSAMLVALDDLERTT